jgi:hypothetical protein
MGYPYYDLVQKAHADLKTEGLIQPRGSQEEVEQDKGLLTRRAAWYVNQQRDLTIGLLEKTSGNNSMGYSVDWHLRNSDGEGWDVATDTEAEGGLREAAPVNGDPHGADPARIPSWRPPTAELAQMPDGGVPPEPVPIPPPTDDLTRRVEMLEAQMAQLAQAVQGGFHAHGFVNLPVVLDKLTLRAKGDIDVAVGPGAAPARSALAEGVSVAALMNAVKSAPRGSRHKE